MKRSVSRWLVAAIIGVWATAALVAPGCARDARQTTVIPAESFPKKGLTPLQRGRIRGEVLRVARPAIEAWRVGDTVAMKRYFSSGLVGYSVKQKAGYARQGKVRVRKHTNVSLDVVELASSGREASVQYKFRNRSYFADRRTGRALSKPADKDAEIDMILKRTTKGWVVTRMFSGRDELL